MSRPAQLERYNTRLVSVAAEKDSLYIDSTFRQYVAEEKKIRAARAKKVEEAERRLEKQLHSNGMTVELPTYCRIGEEHCDNLLAQVENLERSGASIEKVREVKRQYISQLEDERRARAPALWQDGCGAAEGGETEPSFAARYEAARYAAAAERERKKIDDRCAILRTEEEVIAAEQARRTAKAQKALAKALYVDDVELTKSVPVQQAEEAVEKALGALKEVELDLELEKLGVPRRPPYSEAEVDQRVRPMRLQYIRAVEELRVARAPHLYPDASGVYTPPKPARRPSSPNVPFFLRWLFPSASAAGGAAVLPPNTPTTTIDSETNRTLDVSDAAAEERLHNDGDDDGDEGAGGEEVRYDEPTYDQGGAGGEEGAAAGEGAGDAGEGDVDVEDLVEAELADEEAAVEAELAGVKSGW